MPPFDVFTITLVSLALTTTTAENWARVALVLLGGGYLVAWGVLQVL